MDIEKLMDSLVLPPQQYCLITNLYEPLIVGDISLLLDKLNKQQPFFPKTVEVLSALLNINIKKHPLLEDWLIVIPYQFIWEEDKKALEGLEQIFNELSQGNQKAWDQWVKEIQQECKTTNDVCDRFYSYILHAYAAIYFIRNNFNQIEFPIQQRNIDIIAKYGQTICAIECKFIRTSKKFDSFFWRYYRAIRVANKNLPILFNKNFIFPPAETIKSLSPEQCTAIKMLVKEVMHNPYIKHEVHFDGLVFEFNPILGVASSIDSQTQYAKDRALYFLNNPLSFTLSKAITQLSKQKYDGMDKILFIGIQADYLFLIDWTSTAMQEIKLPFINKAANLGIRVIFSDDVGFSMNRYL